MGTLETIPRHQMDGRDQLHAPAVYSQGKRLLYH